MRPIITEETIVVNDVVLTPKALRILKILQEKENSGININAEVMGNAVCIMATMVDSYNHSEDKERISQAISDLSIVRDDFIALRKP